MLLFTAALLAQSGQGWFPSPSVTSPLVARQAVVTCGVAASDVQIKFDRTLQEDVITVSSSGRPSDEQFACIATASLRSVYYVTFSRPKEQASYNRIYYRLADEKDHADSRRVMADHDLLSRLPAYNPAKGDLRAYAGQLELLCGISPGSVLALATPTLLTSKVSGLETIKDDQFGCLTSAIAASNLADYGIRFGFIGNEAMPSPQR